MDITCSICCNKTINNDIKCDCCRNCICHECYSNIIFPNFDVVISYYMHEKPLVYKCPFCVHTNVTSYIDNNIHKSVINMLICYKLYNEKENKKLKIEIEDINKKLKIKNDKIENLACSLAIVTNHANIFLAENKLLKDKITELVRDDPVNGSSHPLRENKVKDLKIN